MKLYDQFVFFNFITLYALKAKNIVTIIIKTIVNKDINIIFEDNIFIFSFLFVYYVDISSCSFYILYKMFIITFKAINDLFN